MIYLVFKIVQEFLPTPEEVGLISNYKGDKDNLGQVGTLLVFVHSVELFYVLSVSRRRRSTC